MNQESLPFSVDVCRSSDAFQGGQGFRHTLRWSITSDQSKLIIHETAVPSHSLNLYDDYTGNGMMKIVQEGIPEVPCAVSQGLMVTHSKMRHEMTLSIVKTLPNACSCTSVYIIVYEVTTTPHDDTYCANHVQLVGQGDKWPYPSTRDINY